MTRRDDEIKNLMGNHGYKGLPLSKIVLYLSEASKDIPPSEWETKALKSESENLTSPNVDSDDKIPPAQVIKPKHRVDKTLMAFQQGQKAQKKRNWGISRKNKIPKRDNTYSGAFDPMDYLKKWEFWIAVLVGLVIIANLSSWDDGMSEGEREYWDRQYEETKFDREEIRYDR